MITYNKKVGSPGNLLWGGAGAIPEQDRTTWSHPRSPHPWEASSGLEEQHVQWGRVTAVLPCRLLLSSPLLNTLSRLQSHFPLFLTILFPAIYSSAGFLCWSAPYHALKTALFPNSCNKPTQAPHMREKRKKKKKGLWGVCSKDHFYLCVWTVQKTQ